MPLSLSKRCFYLICALAFYNSHNFFLIEKTCVLLNPFSVWKKIESQMKPSQLNWRMIYYFEPEIANFVYCNVRLLPTLACENKTSLATIPRLFFPKYFHVILSTIVIVLCCYCFLLLQIISEDEKKLKPEFSSRLWDPKLYVVSRLIWTMWWTRPYKKCIALAIYIFIQSGYKRH